MLFPPLDKGNIRDEVKGLRDYFGEVYRGAGHAMPYTLNRVKDSRQSLVRRDRRMKAPLCMLRPPLRCGVRCVGVEEISDPFPGCIQ